MRNRLLVILTAVGAVIVIAPIAAVLFFMPVRSEGAKPQPLPTVETELDAIARVRAALAEGLGLPSDRIERVSHEARDWPDGCLGLGGPHESCLLAIVPGYRVEFRDTENTDQYIVRMNLDGSVYRIESEGRPGEPAAGEIAEVLRFALMQRLDDESLQVVSIEPETWSNGCLGLPSPMACTEALVPGYRVVLRAADGDYVLRTDLAGSFYRIESSPVGFPAAPDFAWRGAIESGCLQVALFAHGTGVVAGCGESPTRFEIADSASLDHLARLLAWRPVEITDGDIDQLIIRGMGNVEAGDHELRAASEWGRLIAQAAEAGRRGASWGLAISWQDDAEQGCAHVHLERFGVAYVSRCTPETNLDDVVLDADQLASLYGWLDRYAPFEDYGDADSFFVFSGSGSEQANDEAREELRGWIEALHPDR